uniref:Cadherin domain-containing protein n=1 Tax=Stegastes partitus TaxID=144197 RepID=A0A3B5A9T2_9TELE
MEKISDCIVLFCGKSVCSLQLVYQSAWVLIRFRRLQLYLNMCNIKTNLPSDHVVVSKVETSGELFTTNFLDRETVAIYRLTVIGSDKHPTQPLSSSVLVTVLIGDINDHWPQFMDSPYVAYMPTGLAPGSVVCAVRATDGDTDMNAELHYSLYGPSSDWFSIDPYSGTVFTSSALQRTEDIIVNVHVEDGGEDPRFDTTTISISYSLSEDEPVETLVAVVSATSTRAEPVSFYLASGNFEDTFHVEQLSGALTVENPLDHENKKEFSLLIEARDSGSPPFSSFSVIYINITDVNDNFPQFTQEEYRCEVFENSPPSAVCDVLAVDADSGNYGTVQYNITEGNTDNFFIIDPENGLLSTTGSLDRENIPEFNLTVEAAELDNPLHKDRTAVIVTVLDRNDNAPRFSQIFYTELPEDVPVGHTIIQVTSTDDDTDANAVINYFITDQSDDMLFNIDVTTGYITVEGRLDREVQDHYILKVHANDSAWSISTDVTIVLLDVNDNRPVFSDHLYTVVLLETKDKEVLVLQVVATDVDVGQNSEIFYVIEPPNEEFWVNASSGEIFTKQPLMLRDSAFETYQFTVMAFDCGNVPLYSNATVIVRLEQYNQHPPMFLPLQPLIAVPYHLPVGTEVVQFTAIDQDVNSSAHIEYILNGGNASDFFRIQLVLRFNGSDYIEYVIKERFKRDYLIKHVVGVKKEAHIRDQTVINIKFKTKEDGVLMFILGQMGYIMLKVGLTCIYIIAHLVFICVKHFISSKSDKRQKACVHFQRHTVRTPVRAHCGLSCGGRSLACPLLVQQETEHSSVSGW